MSDAKTASLDADSFSLTACGPVDRLQARLGIAGAEPPRLVVRAVALALFAWLPLFVFSLVTRGETSPDVTFFQDVAAYVRFLVVIPLLVFAEATVGRRTRMVAQGFATSGLIRAADAPRFVAIVRSTRKLADSFLAETIIAVIALAAVWLTVQGLEKDGVLFWYERGGPSGERLAPAGWWYAYVASPIALFLFLRWAWRFMVWTIYLRRLSKLDLHIMGTHPDRSGGLGFITIGHDAFSICIFAASAVVAAAAANRVLYEGVQLKEYQSAIIGFIVMAVVFGIAPLLAFMKPLVLAKRKGLLEYGELSSRYVKSFEQKWIEKGPAPDEPLLGSGDIQSLADLGGSYERLDTMRTAPFDRRTMIAFAAAAAAPMLPLLLTVMPLREMVQLLVKAML